MENNAIDELIFFKVYNSEDSFAKILPSFKKMLKKEDFKFLYILCRKQPAYSIGDIYYYGNNIVSLRFSYDNEDKKSDFIDYYFEKMCNRENIAITNKARVIINDIKMEMNMEMNAD